MPKPNLLFIDTNIWLDFYRARTETLKLLEHAEALSDKLMLYSRLSEALKVFKIEVSAQEEASENQLVIDVEDRMNPDAVPFSTLRGVLSEKYSSRTSGLERLEALRKILTQGTEESS